MDNLFDNVISFFSRGGDPELDKNPETDVTASSEITEPDVPEPEQLGEEISTAYLDFFENYGENLYLSDLIVFKTKKDLMREHNTKFGIPDVDEEAQSLAIKSGFYDKLKEKPNYKNLPFKDSILRWAPGVDQLSQFLGLNKVAEAGVSAKPIGFDKSVDVTKQQDLGKGFNMSGTVNVGKSLKKDNSVRGNIKLTKNF